MQEFGLNALKEALRAGSPAMEIDGHCKMFLEEELEVHEAGESGRSSEFDEEIKVLRSALPARGGTEEPEFLHPEGAEFDGKPLNGVNQWLRWIPGLD